MCICRFCLLPANAPAVSGVPGSYEGPLPHQEHGSQHVELLFTAVCVSTLGNQASEYECFSGTAPLSVSRTVSGWKWNYCSLDPLFFSPCSQHIPVDSLIKEQMSVSLEFLQWFNFFYNSNCKDPRASQETGDGQKLTSDPGRSNGSGSPHTS